MTYETLLQTVKTHGKLTTLGAEKVIAFYKTARVVKYNAHDQYTVVHGSALDKATIHAALALANSQENDR